MGKGFCRRYISCNQRRTIPRSVFIQRFKTKYTRKCVHWCLIIKEIFGISDDEVVENLMLDPRYQYALHTTSFDEQPMSDKTLSRFRKRCYDYESIYGVDLLHGCMTGLGTNIAKLMDINPRIKRMDSMMIAANIRKLSRIELLYTCVAKLVIYLHKNHCDNLIKGMEHYCDPNDYNKIFYYSNDSDTVNQLDTILKDADSLLKSCGTDYDDITEYQLLVRCLSEQTVVEEASRRFVQKKMADSIPKCSRIHLIRMRHTESKQEKSIKVMQQISKRQSVKTVQ